MNCKNCGTKLESDVLFCPNCGTKVVPQENPIPLQETSFDEATTEKKILFGLTKKQLLIGGIAIIAAMIVFLVLLGSLFGGNSSKGVVKDYYKALETANAGKLLDTVPKDYLEELMDDRDISKKELKKSVQEYLDDYSDKYDDIRVTFESKKKMNRDDWEKYLDVDDLDDDEIKKAIQYELKIRYESDGGDAVNTKTEDFIVFRYEGSWYSLDALFLVSMAVYL